MKFRCEFLVIIWYDTHQSWGSGAGNLSTYSISIMSSNEMFRSRRCLLSVAFKNSFLIRKSNSIATVEAIDLGFSFSNVLMRLLSSWVVTEAWIAYGVSGIAKLKLKWSFETPKCNLQWETTYWFCFVVRWIWSCPSSILSSLMFGIFSERYFNFLLKILPKNRRGNIFSLNIFLFRL